MLFSLAWQSLLERRLSAILTVVTICISVFISAGVVHVRNQAQSSFDRTISGVDVIIGPRTSQINLLLYSVFRIGNPANGISWESYELIKSDNRIDWIAPIALGDSHQGYRVIGTNNDYFSHFQYGDRQPLSLQDGRIFEHHLEAVLGAEVARQLDYQTGDTITISHGVGETSFMPHDNVSFLVSGVLKATGTPVDQAVHIPLEGLEIAHSHAPNRNSDERHGGHGNQDEHSAEDTHAKHSEDTLNLPAPSQITAAFAGLHSRAAVFTLQQAINDYPGEALTAVLPGVALAELWQMMGMVENLLFVISLLVLVSSLTGLSIMLLSSMRERQREIYLYRVVGMPSSFILMLVEAEALLMTLLGILSGFLLLFICTSVSQNFLSQRFGLFIDSNPVNSVNLGYTAITLLVATLLALIPALSAYRHSMGNRLEY